MLGGICTGSGDCDVHDFATFYAAGRLNRIRLETRAALNIYDPVLITQSVQETMAPLLPVELFSIQYPPLFYAVFTPLSCLTVEDAWRVWIYISLGLLSLVYAATAFGSIRSMAGFLFGLLLVLTCLPALHLFISGQTTAIEAAAIACTFALLRRERNFLAGFLCTLAMLKTQFWAIPLVPGFCLGKRRFALGFFCGMALQAILAAVVVGNANVLNFARAIYLCEITRDYTGLNDIGSMYNLRGSLYLFTHSPSVTVLSIAVYLLACLALMAVWLVAYPRISRSPAAFELCAGMTCLSLLICALHCFLYDYVLLIIPCVLMVRWCLVDKAAPVILRLAILAMLLCLSPLFWVADMTINLPVMLRLYVYHLFPQALASLLLILLCIAFVDKCRHTKEAST